VIELNGIKILFLPCDQYNCSPPENEKIVSYPKLEALVIHFKGRRKRFKQQYWSEHLRAIYVINCLTGYVFKNVKVAYSALFLDKNKFTGKS